MEIAAGFQPHLALVDIGLPLLSGYEVARCIRAQPGGEDIVLAAVSGWGLEGEQHEATEAGFDAHLTKPAEPRAIDALLERIRPHEAGPATRRPGATAAGKRGDRLAQSRSIETTAPVVAAPAAPTMTSGACAPIPDDPDPLRIVVVDDDPDSADSLALLLRRHGFRVRSEHGGEAGLKAVAEFAPDVVIADLQMPRLGGRELAARLGESDAPILLIALSGHAEEEVHARAAEAGFDHHFVKPVDVRSLVELLQRAARVRRGLATGGAQSRG